MARRARAAVLTELRAELLATYPAAFPQPPAAPVLLAVDIHDAVIAAVGERHSRATVLAFLGDWTNRIPYLTALAAGEARRHLDGTPAGEPSDQDRHVAAAALEMRRRADAAEWERREARRRRKAHEGDAAT